MNRNQALKIFKANKDSSEEELKKKYKELCYQHHPDRNQNDKEAEQKFKEVQEAWKVLQDKNTKFEWPGGFPQGFAWHYSQSPQKRQRPKGWDDREIEINIVATLKDIKEGKSFKRPIKINRTCKKCQGRGGEKEEQCLRCNGEGMVVTVSQFENARFMSSRPCDSCRGFGTLIINKCGSCDMGVVQETEIVEFKIVPNRDVGDEKK